ncbi:MAG: hypothetical protein RLZZ117_1607 [Cyanobacteriota bacterium]|jgi:hypothetical protein
MTADLLRNSLKLAVAIGITAALAEHFDRLSFAWYPLLAVVIVVDDNDDQTLRAASGRILGTVVGCLLTFWVHSVASGWPGVFLTLLLLVPVLRLLGWQSAMGTAGLIPIVFLMIPAHVELDWTYAVDRSLDTAVGCAVALAVGLLFWPRSGLQQLGATEENLRQRLREQLVAYRDWLDGRAPRPDPLPAAALSSSVERLETFLRGQLAGPRGRAPHVVLWRRRVALWQSLRLHWVQWERLLAASELPSPAPGAADPLRGAIGALASHLDGSPAVPPPSPTLDTWTRLARESDRSLLTVLALGEEQRPLLACSQKLAELGLLPTRP